MPCASKHKIYLGLPNEMYLGTLSHIFKILCNKHARLPNILSDVAFICDARQNVSWDTDSWQHNYICATNKQIYLFDFKHQIYLMFSSVMPNKMFLAIPNQECMLGFEYTKAALPYA